MKKSIYLSILVVLILSCTDDDNNSCNGNLTYLDVVYLDQDSESFIPYSGEESVYFINENGDEVKFESVFGPKSESIQYITFEIECDEGGQNKYEFHRQQFAVTYNCPELNVEYGLNLFTHNSSYYPIFVDRLNVNLYVPPTGDMSSHVLPMGIIASYKNNENLLNVEFDSYENYEFFDELELLNKTFKDVYKIADPENRSSLTELYFNKNYGVIGIKSESIIWVFNRFE